MLVPARAASFRLIEHLRSNSLLGAYIPSTSSTQPACTAGEPSGTGAIWHADHPPTPADSRRSLHTTPTNHSSAALEDSAQDSIESISYQTLDTSVIPEALQKFHQAFYGPRKHPRRGGCIGLQEEIAASGQASVMQRPCMQHLAAALQDGALQRVLLDGPTGCGKSVALVALVEHFRRDGWLVMYIPSAFALTRGGYFTKRPQGSTWDTLISAQHILKSVYDTHQQELKDMPQQGAGGRGSLLDLVKEGLATSDNGAKAVDACLALKEEMLAAASPERRVLFAVDDYSALHWRTDYGAAVHQLMRRELAVDELTLAAGLRLLQAPLQGSAQVVAATSASRGIPAALQVPTEATAHIHLPRLDQEEVEAALRHYHATGVAPSPPTPENVRRLQALSNGNFRELRQLVARTTAYDLNIYH